MSEVSPELAGRSAKVASLANFSAELIYINS